MAGFFHHTVFFGVLFTFPFCSALRGFLFPSFQVLFPSPLLRFYPPCSSLLVPYNSFNPFPFSLSFSSLLPQYSLYISLFFLQISSVLIVTSIFLLVITLSKLLLENFWVLRVSLSIIQTFIYLFFLSWTYSMSPKGSFSLSSFTPA